VQGVGFRATAKAIARNHAVTGWVRNEDNGSVLLEVQGGEDVVKAFVDDLHRDMARFIKTSASASIAIVNDEPDFSIRR
jgi:acylphosphatase